MQVHRATSPRVPHRTVAVCAPSASFTERDTRGIHVGVGRQPGHTTRCREHGLTHDVFIPQLRRLLRPGGAGDRRVYDSLVADVLRSENPLDLFPASKRRSGVLLIEALYRTHVEQAESGDLRVHSSLGALGYSRWVAWRRFREAIRDGSIGYGRGLGGYLHSSKEDVAAHLRSGWRPVGDHQDAELRELLHRP